VKTLGDIERWLKGAGKGYRLKMETDRDKFTVHYALPGADGCYYIAPKSATLEGALENLLEELRRKENGAESMRTEKPQASGKTVSMSMAALKAALAPAVSHSFMTPVGAVGPVNPPSFTPVQVNCPDCYEYPCNFDFDNIEWVCCCGKRWQDAITTGDVYYLTAYIGATPKKWQCTSLSAAGWVLVP
jgi:hypothetical protein